MLEDEEDINDVNLSTYPGSVITRKRKFEEETENEKDESDDFSDFGNSLLDISDISMLKIKYYILIHIKMKMNGTKKKKYKRNRKRYYVNILYINNFNQIKILNNKNYI